MIKVYKCIQIKPIMWEKQEITDGITLIVKQKTFGKNSINIHLSFNNPNDETLNIITGLKESAIPNDKYYKCVKQVGNQIQLNDFNLDSPIDCVIPIGLSENTDEVEIIFTLSANTGEVEAYLVPVSHFV